MHSAIISNELSTGTLHHLGLQIQRGRQAKVTYSTDARRRSCPERAWRRLLTLPKPQPLTQPGRAEAPPASAGVTEAGTH